MEGSAAPPPAPSACGWQVMASTRRCVVSVLLAVAALASASPTATASPELIDAMRDVDPLRLQVAVKEVFSMLLDKDPPTQDRHEHRKYINDTGETIAHYGYPVERHAVRTEDGYILGVFRIPNPGKPAVFLQHGFLTGSGDFVFMGEGRSLAFVLFDAGFDVWIGNNRGNTYSRRHERLSPADPAFWDFSLQEIGARDLPASLDHVLAATNQTQLHYVGHSQGTTTFFILGSERPEYMDKVKTFVAMAPIAFLRDMTSTLVRLLTASVNLIKIFLRVLDVNVFLPRSRYITNFVQKFGAHGRILEKPFLWFIFLITGKDYEQFDGDTIALLVENAPEGVSTKQMLQFAQNIHVKDLVLRKYDYGAKGNTREYGQRTPPAYDFRRVTAPSYLMYTDNDLLSAPSNIKELVRLLPNIPADGVRKVWYKNFNHLDFAYARNAREVVYDDIVKILQRREGLAPE